MARGSNIAAIIIAVLAVALVVLASAVVRLENYRYANFVGFCTEFDIKQPVQRIEREKCLERGCAGFYMTPVRTVPASASKAVTSSIIVPTSDRLDAFARSADIYNGRRQFTHVELKAECP